MDRRHHGEFGLCLRTCIGAWPPRELLSSVRADAKRATEQRLARGGTQRDEQPGVDALNLGAQPRHASPDLPRVRSLVNAALDYRCSCRTALDDIA
jgi:hypothetical protein